MRSVLARAGFRRLAATYSLNEFADWLATIALAVLVWDRTHDPLATSALLVCSRFLPSLVVPALATRAERLPVARCLGLIYAAEAIVFGALALSSLTFSLPLICALTVVEGGLAATARAVTRAASAAVLEPDGLLREGNAVLNTGFATMNIAGPAAAGFLTAAIGPGAVCGVAGAVFLGLAALAGTARGLPAATADAKPWTARLREGLAYVRGHASVRLLVVGQGLVLVFATLVTPIEVIYAKETLGAGDAGFGTLLTGWGIGIVLGSVVFARARSQPLHGLLLASTSTVALGFFAMALAPTLAWATLAAALGGLGNGVQWVAAVTAMQEAVTKEMQGRVAGLYEAVATAMPGLGFVAGGVLVELLSTRAAFTVAGAGLVLLVLAGLLLRRTLAGPAAASPRRSAAAALDEPREPVAA